MIYKTVFDVAETGYRQWRGLGIGFSLVLLFGILFFGMGAFPYFWLPKRSAIFLNGMGFVAACFGVIFIFSSTLYDYISARIALERGDYSVVQGRITDFKPLPPERTGTGAPGITGDESFSVQGVNFAYSDYDTTAGFNKTKREGNQLENGVQVRVTYKNNKKNEILRLEVASQNSK